MESQTSELVNKVDWIFRLLDATYLLRNEPLDDHTKRTAMRMAVIQIDNLSKIVGQLKNNLHREGLISIDQKQHLENIISSLASSYDNAFDTVRDKLAAHAQPLDLVATLDWWGSFDYSTVEILYGDCKLIQSALESIDGMEFKKIPDYSQILAKAPVPICLPKLSTGRLAIAEANTMGIIANHPSQEKVQIVVSIARFLQADFHLTQISNNPNSIYKTLVFDIGWMLAFMDFCSLIDNLFEFSQYDKSLLEYWDSGFLGLRTLQQLNQSRDLALEAEVRKTRNRFAAHLDKNEQLDVLYEEFQAIDIVAVHEYTQRLVNGFQMACGADIKTRIFKVNDIEIKNVTAITNAGRPFED